MILLQYGDVHHVAVIQEFTSKGFRVKEANFKQCEATERIVYYSDEAIKGFNSFIVDESKDE